MRERAGKAGLGFFVATGLVGLGGGGAVAADEATIMLNWFQLADHSPLYLARERGYYEDEDIELSIVRGHGSGDTAKKIDLEQAEFGISDVPTVLTAISKGADLVIVGMVYDKAANNIFFYKDSGIEQVEDLPGKAIAAPPGDSHRFLWPALARHHDVDPESVTLVNVKPEGKQAIVAARNADAAFDLYTSYPIWEKVLGEGNVGNLLFADHGIALYGHGYIVNQALTVMTPEQIELVQASFARIAPRKDEVAGLVYERLFTLDPSLRALFRGDMVRQRSRLALAIVMVVHGLKNRDAIVPVLEELGRRHVDYGVKAEHYATVGKAVLFALEQALGDDFTPEVRQAWANAYDLIARTMIEAAERAYTPMRAPRAA